MCKISGSLKLCTCSKNDVRELHNYWVLYKYQQSDIFLMGETMPLQELEIGKQMELENSIKLELMLNKGNCFDKEISPDNKDLLQLHFTCVPDLKKKQNLHLVYEFIYRKSKWMSHKYDPFNQEKIQKDQGKISNPFHVMPPP